MPTSDVVFLVIGAVDAVSIFVLILWTAVMSRKDVAGERKEISSAAAK
jgi:hypothetical protein